MDDNVELQDGSHPSSLGLDPPSKSENSKGGWTAIKYILGKYVYMCVCVCCILEIVIMMFECR